jgi:hypothetical protein
MTRNEIGSQTAIRITVPRKADYVMIRTATKITAVTGATVLSFGLAAPAFANNGSDPSTTTPSPSTHSHAHMALTVDQLRTIVVDNIDGRLAWIVKAQSRVTASTTMTADQKAAETAKLTSATAALTDLKAKVVAATTKSEIRDAIQAADVKGKLLRTGRDAKGHRGLCNGHVKTDPNANKADANDVSVKVGAASDVPGDRANVRTFSFHHGNQQGNHDGNRNGQGGHDRGHRGHGGQGGHHNGGGRH